ncbi:hypothetical protein BH10BDE1_BH10BDE1_30770 [soil metagenome]
MQDRIDVILKLIKKLNPQAVGDTVSPDVNLLDSGILDSIITVQLVLALETELGITFQFEDIKPENFKTLTAISSMLATKYGAR